MNEHIYLRQSLYRALARDYPISGHILYDTILKDVALSNMKVTSVVSGLCVASLIILLLLRG